MKGSSFICEHLFVPAIILSASAHVILIAASGWISSSVDFSVLDAPSSLEFTVVSQPHVSVIEEEIVTEEIIEQEPVGKIVFKELVKNDLTKEQYQPSISSQESLGAVTEAKPLMQTNLAPPYPKIARQRGWEGTVRLSVLVEKDGVPYRVGIQQSSGHRVLDNAAVKSVKLWKFSPARSGELRFSSKIIIPIQFTLIRQL